MEERGFFCFMAPVYLLAPNMLLTFLIIFTPSISPSKTAMPVLKARIMASVSYTHLTLPTNSRV